MSRQYPFIPIDTLSKLFYLINIIDVIYSIISTPIGIISIKRKSIRYIDLYNLICLVGLFTNILGTYIDTFNYLSFLL